MKKYISFVLVIILVTFLITSCSVLEAEEEAAVYEEVVTNVVEEELPEEETPAPVEEEPKTEETETEETEQESGIAMPVEVRDSIFEDAKAIAQAASEEAGAAGFIENYLTEAQIDYSKDESGNIIAARGEGAKVILHSSMAIEKDDSMESDGEKISSEVHSNLKKALGVATGLYMIKNYDTEKPLKVIFTTNDAEGKYAAYSLAKEQIDAPYVIDLEHHNALSMCNAGGGKTYAQLNIAQEQNAPAKDTAMKIIAEGFLGGYSYNSINSGRANAIKLCGQMLRYMAADGVAFELASINGGSCKDTLPEACSVTIVVDSATAEKFEEIFSKAGAFAFDPYREMENKASIRYEKTDMPEKVFKEDAKTNIINAICLAKSGVNSMAQKSYGVVESSSNISMIKTEGNGVAIAVCVESEDKVIAQQLLSELRIIGENCSMNMTTEEAFSPWEELSESTLTNTAKEVYASLTEKDIWVTSVREHTPCQAIYSVVPEIDMISLGYEISYEEDGTETLKADYMPITYCMITGILDRLA